MTSYAVSKGRVPGVYTSWPECEKQVKGYSGNIHKKFSFLDEAQQFVESGNLGNSILASPPHISASLMGASSKRIIVLDSGEWDIVHCEVYQGEDKSVGVGVWWRDDSRNISERCPGVDDLKRGHLVAVARALENVPPGNSSILVKTTAPECISLIQKLVELSEADTVVERNSLTSMPLSIYLPRLIRRLRQKGRRIEFQHMSPDSISVSERQGVRGAKELAMLGALKDGERRVWALNEEDNNVVGHLQIMLASLELGV